MKNSLTKTLTIIALMISFSGFSQSPPINSINAQLRALFQDLDKPVPSLPFLYDMSAKMSDSVFYQHKNFIDTIDADSWFMIYGEMYHAAYDTLDYIFPDTLFYHANGFYSDTIPMGVMCYHYYKFKEDALTTDTYFDFDTINTILTDKYPRPGFPYNDSAIFIATPLIGSSYYSNPVFHVDPQFMKMNNECWTNSLTGHYILKMDFDDGNGWVVFNPFDIVNYPVNYTTGGYKLIKTAFFSPLGDIIHYSQARLLILSSDPVIAPDYTFSKPGMTVGVYGGCEADLTSGRIVIYLEGFDVKDEIPAWDRNVSRIYTEQISNDRLVQLKNDGYTFLVVDWENSRTDIRFNALYLINLLEYLKAICTTNEQFVIIGESMGGLVARYALTFMETQQYKTDNYTQFFTDELDFNNILYLSEHPLMYSLPSATFHKEKKHNTRLLITLDTPNKGANIPLSLQWAYRDFLNLFGPYVGEGLTLASKATNTAIDGQAAQQMLMYHVDTKSLFGFYHTYSQKADFFSFFNQLWGMGNYPKYAKVVAMSQGSLSGQPQTNFYPDPDVPRIAGDRIIDFSSDLYARVVGIRIPIFGGDLECNTNPDGDGKIFKANAGHFTIHIKLKWFGVRITTGYLSLLDEEEFAHTLPLCTSPGGSIFPIEAVKDTIYSGGWDLSQKWLFNLVHWNYSNDGLGCFEFNSHVGFNGVASVNEDISCCSDGGRFCFVPVQSALDFGPTYGFIYPLNQNIETMNISTKLAMAKADVITGYTGNGTGRNHNHTGTATEPYRNDNIYNLTNETSYEDPDNLVDYTYYSCVNYAPNVQRGFLNLEIGDEELYLEDVTLPWYAKYQVEYDLHVNQRNPHYQYIGYINPPPMNVPGVYSKKDPFIVQGPDGFAEFHYDSGSPTGIGFIAKGFPKTFYSKVDEPLYVCCVDFLGTRKADEQILISKAENYLIAYPNPNNGNQITLDYSLSTKGKQRIEIINLFGEKLYSKELMGNEDISNMSFTIDMKPLNLSSGFYIIRITNGSEFVSSKIIIER